MRQIQNRQVLPIPAPYIIIGMHRSGTSLLANVLEKSGIFMGCTKDHNFESMPFLSQNQEALWAEKANWLNPKVPDPSCYTPYSNAFFFYEHFKANGRWAQLKLHFKVPRWGWKDPRNTFTLPMWLGLFPKAKVIHVHRNPEAVISSLQQRNKVEGEVFDKQLNDRSFCESLYHKYLETARNYSDLGQRYFEISFEDLCSFAPQPVAQLEKFCGVSIMQNLKQTVKVK